MAWPVGRKGMISSKKKTLLDAGITPVILATQEAAIDDQGLRPTQAK
jgi:hypothetical protein